MIKLSNRRKRRNQRERFGETRPLNWRKLFPEETKKVIALTKVRPKIQEKISEQPESQKIGRLREKKVKKALQLLKQEGKITAYFQTGELSYANLIEGVDFVFVYINNAYKVCRFSVTGQSWVKRHQQRHPENPILPVDSRESVESIEQRISLMDFIVDSKH